MITVVLDASKTLDASDIYKPLLYRSMRNDKCFYIKSDEHGKIEKIKSIIKYYPRTDYELIVLLDLTIIGESLFEKIHLINKEILSEIFGEVKQAAKIRYVILDYINSNYLEEEYKFIRNIEEIQTEQELAEYLNNINKSPVETTWTEEMANNEYLNAKDLFIQKILPSAEVNVITLNKLPSEEKENFIRNIYLRVYGFINLVADELLDEDFTSCCYQELPIYNVRIELNEEAIEETAKRYILNLENEEKELDLNSFEKIEYTALFDENETDEYKKVLNEIKTTKLQIKRPSLTLFNIKKDIKKLNTYVEKAKEEYKRKCRILNSMYGKECQKVRDDLNKEFAHVKNETKERFEIENKINEEKAKIEQLKYKKSKLIMENKEDYEQYEEYLDEQYEVLEDKIQKRKINLKAVLLQFLGILLYITMFYVFLKDEYIKEEDFWNNLLRLLIAILIVWILVLIVKSCINLYRVRKEYKNVTKKLENLFLRITETQREGIESIQYARQLIKSKKTIKHLQKLLNKANEQTNKLSVHKSNLRNHKNFCNLISEKLFLDGSFEADDLDSTFNIDMNELTSYKNKAYSFLDYINYNKYQMSLKKANTSKVIKIEKAGTYISYVSID